MRAEISALVKEQGLKRVNLIQEKTLCFKQREVYAARAAMLQKMRMVGEIVVFAMFEDKDALCG